MLCGCAAREVHPVALSQVGDEQLSCQQIHLQIEENRAAIAPLLRQQKLTNGSNVAMAIVGLPLAAAADFSEHDQIKARSMADRNEKLNYLAKNKGC